MDLSKIKPSKGSTASKKRLGRGQGSGWGGTSSRGHKGAQSRSGYSRKIGFEGGQMPLQRVVPKSGFKNFNRVEYKAVNLNTLQQISESKNLTVIDISAFLDAGIISRKDRVKILGKGTLTAKLTVKAHAFSKSAAETIKNLEGTIEIL